MLPSVGFVLVTADLPELTVNLCRKLSEMFDDPPIALHHDFGQCSLDPSILPANVHLVTNWHQTSWGHISVPDAVFSAFRLLYSIADPDWCVSLSNTDYPIKTAQQILSDLRQTDADAFLDHREIVIPRLPENYTRVHAHAFRDPRWLELAYDRYVSTEIIPNRIARRLKSLKRRLYGRLARNLFTPFKRGVRPFGGESWYTVNRRAAHFLIANDRLARTLRKHYRNRPIPEESLYHSILCNRPELTICNQSLRYTDWSNGGKSPKILGEEDIPALLASPAHFARKFPLDPDLFSQIDHAVETAARKSASSRQLVTETCA
jgi:Core-2/I-Branching enzyme